MANVQIYQLDNAGSDLDNSALLAMDIPNPDASAASEVPYVTRKESIASLETQMLQTDEYTTALDTTSKSIVGAINELRAINGYSYDAYDDTSTYSVGDLCIYNTALYKCTTAITTAEAWNANHWTATSIAEEIGAVNTALSDKTNTINTLWGTSCETLYTKRSQFLVIEASSGLYTVWFASTNQINVKEWTNNAVASGNDTVTLSNLIFERINKTGVTNEYKLRVSVNGSTAFTIIN